MRAKLEAFLAAVYDKIGMSVLNDAAKNVPAVRLAGGALLLAMFAAAALAAFQNNVRLLVAAVIVFVVVMALLVILGAVSQEGTKSQAQFFSWVIVVLLALVLCGITSSFLIELPRPLNELLLGDASISVKDVVLEIAQDAGGNLIVTTQGVPQEPYGVNVRLTDPVSKAELGAIPLSLRRRGEKDPSGQLNVVNVPATVVCKVELTRSGRVVSSTPLTVTITPPKKKGD